MWEKQGNQEIPSTCEVGVCVCVGGGSFALEELEGCNI